MERVPNGTYTLTPSLSGYSFSPANLSVTVNGANLTGKNFAVQYIGTTGKITGTIYNDSNGNGYVDRHDFATNPDGSLGAPLAFNDGLGGRPKAIGFAITDLDLGIFVGLDVQTVPTPSLCPISRTLCDLPR